MTQDEFIKKEIAIWGFDEIEYLLNEGYEVVRVEKSDGTLTWGWRHVEYANQVTYPANATVKVTSY